MNTQQFLEEWLPNYSSRDEVARLDDLHKYLAGEMSENEIHEKGFFINAGFLLMPPCFREYYELQDKLFAEAIENYTKQIVDKTCKLQRGIIGRGFDDHPDASIDAPQPTIEEVMSELNK